METFSHHSARVKCWRKGRIGLASYSGPLCANGMDELRARVVRSTKGAQCLVLRMDSALMMMAAAPTPATAVYSFNAAPGAVIVRPDQYDLWTDYARAMALIGVRRCVFLTSERDLCRQWVDWQLVAHP